MGQVDFKLDDLQLRTNIAKLGPTINKYITLTVDHGSDEAVGEMKLKAPWTDRTTNARSGLFTKASHSGSGPIGFERHDIVFGHAVNYGIWLEIKDINRGGRPIIVPTMIATGKAIMEQLQDLFRDLNSPDSPRISLSSADVNARRSRPNARARAEVRARAGRARGATRTTTATRRTRRT